MRAAPALLVAALITVGCASDRPVRVIGTGTAARPVVSDVAPPPSTVATIADGATAGASVRLPSVQASPDLAGLAALTPLGIVVIEPDGAVRRLVRVPDGATVAPLVFSADGRWLATVLTTSAGAEVIAVPVDGSAPARTWPCECTAVTLSPLGLTAVDASGRLAVFPVDSAGGVVSVATDLPVRDAPVQMLTAVPRGLLVLVPPATPGDPPVLHAVTADGGAVPVAALPVGVRATGAVTPGPAALVTMAVSTPAPGAACGERTTSVMLADPVSGQTVTTRMPAGDWEVRGLAPDGNGSVFGVFVPLLAEADGSGTGCRSGPPQLHVLAGLDWFAVGGGLGDGVQAVAVEPGDGGRVAFGRLDTIAANTPAGVRQVALPASLLAWQPRR